MKRILLVLAVVLANLTTEAQIKTPMPSPHCSFTQTVGLTDITVEYSRPSAKGRTIFGDLVPFGKTWRTGANANTTISFSEDVMIKGETLKKGKYAIYTLPKADVWEVVFYSASENWGTPDTWDESKVALRTTTKPTSLPNYVETFTMGINNLTSDNATLDFSWEKTMASVKIDFGTKTATLASIDKALSGPTSNDYFAAAQYYYNSDLDMNKALEYMNKAISMVKPGTDIPYYQLRTKSLIQAKLGDKKGAIETARLSLAGSEKAKNNDYIKMNNDSIKEWSKK